MGRRSAPPGVRGFASASGDGSERRGAVCGDGRSRCAPRTAERVLRTGLKSPRGYLLLRTRGWHQKPQKTPPPPQQPQKNHNPNGVSTQKPQKNTTQMGSAPKNHKKHNPNGVSTQKPLIPPHRLDPEEAWESEDARLLHLTSLTQPTETTVFFLLPGPTPRIGGRSLSNPS